MLWILVLILVLFAIFGGLALSKLLWLLLILALIVAVFEVVGRR